MPESVARAGMTRLSGVVAILAFALIVVAGADLRAGGTDGCAGWGDCSGWTHLSTTSGAIGRLHLAVAGVTGLATISLVALSWLRLQDDRRVVRASIAALALIGAQLGSVLLPGGGQAAILGATTHLAATALLLALALYLATLPAIDRLRRSAIANTTNPGRERALVGWAVSVIFAVLVSGAFLTAADNATTCAGWPLCGSHDVTSSSSLITPDAHGLHRLFVAGAAGLLAVLGVQIVRARGASRPRMAVVGSLIAIFTVEVVVGAFSASGADGALVSATHFGAAGLSWSLLIILALVTNAEVAARPTIRTDRLPLHAIARDYLRVMKPGIIV
ncbi:MAG: COX15/CtaA family protein, partial [Vicinamibacterales bacterium]